MNKIFNIATIGNFDGVHSGHNLLLSYLKKAGSHEGKKIFVLTFDPHPRAIFNEDFLLLNTNKQKEELLRKNGIEKIEFISFNRIKDLSPEGFIKKILIEMYEVDEVIVGHDFKFGKDRRGNLQILKEYSEKYDFKLKIIPPAMVDNTRVSSSWIREKIQKGEVDDPKVLKMLTRNYFVDGKIVRGFGIGKKIGFPTLNISSYNRILPLGVFETRIRIKGEIYKSITNIGVSPTFKKKEISVETYILDFKQNLYDLKEDIRLYFIRKIREEKKFQSSEQLAKQISNDILKISNKKVLITLKKD
jgi:riboflavin kinase/FMN adenylyltransferase